MCPEPQRHPSIRPVYHILKLSKPEPAPKNRTTNYEQNKAFVNPIARSQSTTDDVRDVSSLAVYDFVRESIGGKMNKSLNRQGSRQVSPSNGQSIKPPDLHSSPLCWT